MRWLRLARQWKWSCGSKVMICGICVPVIALMAYPVGLKGTELLYCSLYNARILTFPRSSPRIEGPPASPLFCRCSEASPCISILLPSPFLDVTGETSRQLSCRTKQRRAKGNDCKPEAADRYAIRSWGLISYGRRPRINKVKVRSGCFTRGLI